MKAAKSPSGKPHVTYNIGLYWGSVWEEEINIKSSVRSSGLSVLHQELWHVLVATQIREATKLFTDHGLCLLLLTVMSQRLSSLKASRISSVDEAVYLPTRVNTEEVL